MIRYIGIPCSECIKLAMCVSKEKLICDDLIKWYKGGGTTVDIFFFCSNNKMRELKIKTMRKVLRWKGKRIIRRLRSENGAIEVVFGDLKVIT